MRWLALLLLALSPALAHAWELEGTPVCRAVRDQMAPVLCGDGTGGAYVAWQDTRDEAVNHHDAYLQHLTASGEIAPGWPLDGLAVAVGPELQGAFNLIPDGAGGVLVLIESYLTDPGDLHLQRVTAVGQIYPGWPAGGVPVAVAPGEQSSATMAGDGNGGAWVSWQDERDPTLTAAYFTHVQGDATLAAGWPADGLPFEPNPDGAVGRPLLLSDTAGGAQACWSVWSFDYSRSWLLAGHFDSSGGALPAWPAGGLLASTEQPLGRGPADKLIPDGTAGFYTAWIDYRASAGYYDRRELYAQHVLGSGALAAGWPADGLPVCTLAGAEANYPSLCEDGAGGMYVTWEDYRNGYVQVFAQHLRADGTPALGWPVNGLHVGAESAWQVMPSVVADGEGGVYVTWAYFVASGYHTYVQHLSAHGTPVAGWALEGRAVTSPLTDHYRPGSTCDGAGGLIVAWEDGRAPGTRPDIWAQRFMRDGLVAAAVSLVSAEATPGEVRLRWRVSGAREATLERREGGSAWGVRATLAADGEGNVAFTDREVMSGATYDYRLAFADGTRGGLASVAVPLAYALALEGARPNPARGALHVAFTLPDGAPAQLALYDLAGRRLATREVGERGAGRHLVRLEGGALAPGLYWAALTHGGRTLRSRIAVVR